jgi:hypothetical protein
MAIIIPFADPDAHGSIAGSVTFRRRRGKVVFQKKPHGKQPNTPAQQAQKTKFKDGWKEYHQLNAWELTYLQNKAAQLGTTKANLFLSQFLTDEVASTIPLNQIKEILNLSLPEPISDTDEGILNEFFSQIDDPFTLTLIASIYDKENLTIPGSIVSAHDRSFITIENKTAGPITIPFDYPYVIDYNNQSDIEKTQLIRLPEIILPTPGTPSTTKWTNIKSVQSFTIETTQQDAPSKMQIDLQVFVTGGTVDHVIATVDDNRNISNELSVFIANNDTYIEFRDNQLSPLSLLNGFKINIDWTDDADGTHNDQIALPRFQNDDGGAPSASGTNDMKDVVDMKIKYTQNLLAGPLVFSLEAGGVGGDVGNEFGRIVDDDNVYLDTTTASTYSVLILIVVNQTGAEVTLNEGYSLIVKYINAVGDSITQTIVLPQITIADFTSKTLYLSDDFSVYDEVGLTTLLLKGYINTKRLWIADDLSLYWDQALTNLAKSPKQSIQDIYLASDFSTYFDEALSQLGNTPFF